MSSTHLELPQATWVQATTTDKRGSIKHRGGDTKVVYLEASVAPVGFDPNTPWMEDTRRGEGFPYFDVPTADFIFAYAINGDAKLTITPGE